MGKKSVKGDKTAATTKALHRTAAVEKAYVPGYPQKLYIYKAPASQYWWVRYFVGGKIVRKTTKQTGKREALEAAKEFYDTVTVNYRQGFIATSSSNFQLLVRQVLRDEKAKLKRGEITQITYDNLEYRINKTVLPFFAKYDAKDIDYKLLQEFVAELSEKTLKNNAEKTISSNTVRSYLQIVRKVLVYAAQVKMIQAVPEFPKIKVKDKARGWFTTAEYRKLWSAAKRYVGVRMEIRKYKDDKGNTQTQYINTLAKRGKKGELMKYVDMTEDMRRLIVFMSNSYIRPTDIKVMQHKHVDVVRNEYEYLRLRLPETKGHSFPITTMPKAVDTYLMLKKHHADANDSGKVDDNDYVFMPKYGEKQRDYALQLLQLQFEILMWDTGLGVDTQGNNRTLYSLRHTAIMYRLLFGESINTLLLARNARTSVEMIDRFYAKPLSGEMNIEMLQSKRRRRKYYDGEQSEK